MKLAELDLLEVGHTIQLAGAIYRFKDEATYLLWFPDEKGSRSQSCSHTTEELEMNLEEWTTFIQQTDVLNTMVKVREADGSIGKAILRKSQRQIDNAVSWTVYRRDKYHCQYCYKNDVPLTVDHLILWEEGGPSIEANLLSSCRKCNKTRGNLPYSEWLQHPYYRKMCIALPQEIVDRNFQLIDTLGKIPYRIQQRSR